LLVVWPTATKASLPGVILLAAQCALSLINDLGSYYVPECDATLRLHIGIGTGEVQGLFSFCCLL
jgi:hypothetical protein